MTKHFININSNIDKDNLLSKRFISLDPNGYFIIRIHKDRKKIIAEHYTNTIDKKGTACDPKTKKPIGCNDIRNPENIYEATTAKEMETILLSQEGIISYLSHAFYLGRELQKAEVCMVNNIDYIQD